MTALPTVGRVVHVRMSYGIVAPAFVVSVTDSGALNVVAFSDWWPLTAARVFRNVPAFNSLPADAVYEAAWFWPPRPDVGKVSPDELDRRYEELGGFVAALASRVLELERRGG